MDSGDSSSPAEPQAVDWRAHIQSALDGGHPVLGRSVAFLLCTLIGISTISIGIETPPDLPPWATSLLLRLLRLFKVARYHNALSRLGRAIAMVHQELTVFAAVAIFTLYLCGIGIYYFEHATQPKAFASVVDGMWWAAVTLTTVGYGDVYPVTPGGRLFTVLIMFVALGAVAVPTGLVTAALVRLRAIEEAASPTPGDDRRKA